MTGDSFRTEPLGNREREGFCCGVEALDRYFHHQVSQDIRRRLAACYVALCGDSERICGFYTLSACHIALPDLPAEITRKLPPYPVIPAVRVGRLAVDQDFWRQGRGAAMLVDAARRVIDAVLRPDGRSVLTTPRHRLHCKCIPTGDSLCACVNKICSAPP